MDQRHADYPINTLILNRWSPRAMSGEALSDEILMSLFEAARWAPSCYNAQPWRFIYAKRNTEEWNALFDLLVDFNKEWCKNASCLVVVLSRKFFEKNNKPYVAHAYDTGAAWMNLCLEASDKGLVAHGMSGFDYDKAKQVLNIPDEFEIMAMCAIGKRAPKEVLPADMQEKEKPSTRKPLKELVMHGSFKQL